jgi:hypothetical protein
VLPVETGAVEALAEAKMKANPPEEWTTPKEREEMERLDRMTLTEIRADLISQGVDVDGFTARIKRKIQTMKETGIWPTD